jgi:hypothetical protein
MNAKMAFSQEKFGVLEIRLKSFINCHFVTYLQDHQENLEIL